MIEKKDVLNVLKKVVDPEIGLDIVELGFIYDIKVKDDRIFVKMTLTSPFCPMASFLVEDVREKLKRELKPKDVRVEVTFDPPWSPERMSKKARKKLGFE